MYTFALLDPSKMGNQIIAIAGILPRNLTWNLKMMVSKRNLLFQGLLFRFHVKFQGCTYSDPCLIFQNSMWQVVDAKSTRDSW